MACNVTENNDCVKEDSNSSNVKEDGKSCSSSESELGEEEDPILWTNNKFSALTRRK